MKPIIASLAAVLVPLMLAAPAAPAEMKGALQKLQSLSTGVGLEERAQIPAGYQAKLVFANPKGEYFANVEVRILKGGEERKIVCNGPWLLLKGEPGEYEIQASAGKAKGRQKIGLPAKGMETFVIHLREPKREKMRN